MRLLLIHADHFEYEVKKKAVKEPEEISPEEMSKAIDEALVVFITVERIDEEDPDQVAGKSADAIDEVAGWVKARNIVIYPYAHLSAELGSQDVAIPLFMKVEQTLRNRGYRVDRSPFGWYKSFKISCKGHPLSELSRSIIPEAKKIVKEAEEEAEASEFLILEPTGEEHTLDLKNVEGCAVLKRYPLLKQFIYTEEVGRVPHETPPHIRLMRKLELVDYEPASDIGNFRFYPKGTLLKEELQEFANNIAVKDLHAIKIETPLLYRLDQPDIAGQAAKFRERDYRFSIDDKELTLRFAGDFGLFRMMKDVTMSYKQLPIRIYELSSSYRLERKGECVGLKRLRAFTMPDIHCFCKDLRQGMDEYKEIFQYYTKLANSMRIDYIVAFRVVRDFYMKNKEWFIKLLKIVEKPALFELLPVMKHYWVVKHEYQTIDSVGGNAQLSTVQLDVEDSERYGILYVDADGSKRGCIIVHSSMGSIERWIYALLEQAEKMKREKKAPMLPVWLSPVQVRVIPITGDCLEYAKRIAGKLEERKIRVEIDDRGQTVASKIRDAETEWIPYIAVVGKKEMREGNVSVRVRASRQQKIMKPEEFAKIIDEEIGEKPRLPLHLPKYLSMKPKFI